MSQLSSINYRLSLFLFAFITIGQISLYLDFLPFLEMIFSLSRIFVFCVLLVLYMKKFTFSTFEFFLFIYAIALLSITIFLYPLGVIKCISHIINVSIILSMFKLFDFRLVMRAFAFSLSIIIYVNLILLIIYPDGIYIEDGYERYLIGGNYNGMGPILFLGIVIQILDLFYFDSVNKRINLVLLVAVSLYTVIFVGSMTSTIGIILLLVFLLLYKKRLANLYVKIFLIVIVLLNIFLVYMQSEIDNVYLVWFIEDILGKDLTFSDRFRVWREVIEFISKSPYIGYGEITPEWYDSNFSVLTAHNIILTTLLKGGIVLLILFLLIIYYVVKYSNIRKNSNIIFVQFAICTFFFMMIVESYSIEIIFTMLIILYSVANISNEKQIVEKDEEI